MSTQKGGPNTVTDGLIMYMDAANTRCYSGTGTVWNDLSINKNDGTLMDPITFASSPSRFETNATLLPDYKQILCNNTLTFNDATEYSFDFFVRLESGWNAESPSWNMLTGLIASAPFLAIRGSTLNTDWSVWWRQTGGVYVIGNTVTGNDITDRWVNFAFVIKSNRNVDVYFQGVYLQTLVLVTSAFQVNRIASAYNGGDGNYYSLQGDIATARYYNIALTDAQVLQNYNALKGRFGL